MGDTQERCKTTVWPKGSGAWGRRVPCKRAATNDGFCAIHHPDAHKARDAKWQAKWDAQDAANAKAKLIVTRKEAVIQTANKWEENDCKRTERELVAAIRDLREAKR